MLLPSKKCLYKMSKSRNHKPMIIFTLPVQSGNHFAYLFWYQRHFLWNFRFCSQFLEVLYYDRRQRVHIIHKFLPEHR